MVESQPSKLLVAGSIPVSRSRRAVTSGERRVTSGQSGALESLHSSLVTVFREADVAQLVEHVLGKDGVSGSIPLIGSRLIPIPRDGLIEALRQWPRKNLIDRSRT